MARGHKTGGRRKKLDYKRLARYRKKYLEFERAYNRGQWDDLNTSMIRKTPQELLRLSIDNGGLKKYIKRRKMNTYRTHIRQSALQNKEKIAKLLPYQRLAPKRDMLNRVEYIRNTQYDPNARFNPIPIPGRANGNFNRLWARPQRRRKRRRQFWDGND
jgi:hypothetical protein